jgi:osmoprotectant transport system permease protein
METFIDALQFMGDNPSLFLDKTGAHLLLSGASVAVALAIAVPLGVWLGHIHRGSFIAINASNIGRALPSLAIISIGLGILGIGFLNVLVAMVVLAIPPVLTNAYVAVDGVDEDAVEAARGMGMTPTQVLVRVELPLALPLMFAGIRTAVVYVIATAALASIAGGESLGDIILNQPSYRLPGVIAGAMAVAALAFAAEAVFALVQRAITPPGLKEEKAGRLIGPAMEGV